MHQLDLFAAPPPPPVPAMLASARQARVDDWSEFQAQLDRAEAISPRESLTWGKRRSRCFFEIDLLSDQGEWRYRSQHDMPNMGGCGPFGRDAYPTREAALIHALRHQLGRIADHIAVHLSDGAYGSVPYGTLAEWQSLAKWCIEQAPSPLFGGPDLGSEYETMTIRATAKEARRREELMAGRDQ